jgi:LysR family glycine cleavage system transcriptional activator
MPQALPPLNCLRAFEAAARHLSFKDAARELHVTPAAVGHQIKKLEAHLGVKLFQRFNRGIALTAVGRSMIPDLAEGFGLLARAAKKARTSGARTVLTITVAPSFAAKWLIPRLEQFHVGQQGIAVRIDTDLREIDMASNGIDVALRFGAGQYPGHRVDRLMGEMLIPVCSPRLLGPLLGPAPVCTW